MIPGENCILRVVAVPCARALSRDSQSEGSASHDGHDEADWGVTRTIAETFQTRPVFAEHFVWLVKTVDL